VATVYTLRYRCVKRLTCASCGCVYHVRREFTIDEKARTEEAAAKASTRRITRELELETNAVACPDCGLFQNDLVGSQLVQLHALITGISLACAIAWLIVASWTFARTTIGVGLMFVGIATFLAQAFAAFTNPNRLPAANRKASLALETEGNLYVTREGDRDNATPLVGPYTRWHTVGLIGLLVASLYMLTPAMTRGIGGSPFGLSRTIAPGGELLVELPDRIESINGLWRGAAKITVRNASDFGKQPPTLSATSADTTWPTNLVIESGRDKVVPEVWVKLQAPNDPRIIGSTLNLKIELEVTYPTADGKITKDRKLTVWSDVSVRVANATSFGRLWQVPTPWLTALCGLSMLLFAGQFLRALGRGLMAMAERPTAEVEEVAAAPAAARDERPIPSDPRAAARILQREHDESEPA
jgi:hypothetical protein